MTLREKIIFLLALEWAHSEQKAAPEITIQEVKVKLGEQLLKEYTSGGIKDYVDGADTQKALEYIWRTTRDEVVKEIEKAAKGYKRKIIGIDVVRSPRSTIRGRR